MIEYHPRSAESHNGPDSLAHIRTVAVDRTLVALGLVVSELASVQSGNGVVQQFPALITQLRAAVVLPTPQLNHMPDRLLFPIYASHPLSWAMISRLYIIAPVTEINIQNFPN